MTCQVYVPVHCISHFFQDTRKHGHVQLVTLYLDIVVPRILIKDIAGTSYIIIKTHYYYVIAKLMYVRATDKDDHLDPAAQRVSLRVRAGHQRTVAPRYTPGTYYIIIL